MLVSISVTFHSVTLRSLTLRSVTLRQVNCYVISKGNHMISSAIWDKSARVNLSKTNKIARARRASCNL